MKDFFKITFMIIAILAGVTAIIKILGNPELIIGVLSLTFGIMAMIWTLIAHSSLSPGSSLRSYTNHFLACLIFILLFSIWKTTIALFPVEGMLAYLEYLFLTMAYIVFAVAANKIYRLGREFGFQNQSNKIKQAIKKNEKIKRAKKK